MAKARRILFLAFPGFQLLDIAGPYQMFGGANDERPGSYALHVAAARAGPVAPSSGLPVVADLSFADIDARWLRSADTVIASGGDENIRRAVAEGVITSIIKRAQGRARRIASVCSGTFFLAAAGLLDGKRAATHWRAVAALKKFRPQIEVDGESIYVREGHLWTSAGVTAGMDLALAMIEEDLGREAALKVARRHVVFRIRPGGQTQFSAELDAQGARHGVLEKLTAAIVSAPQGDWRIEAMAAHAGASARTLSRLFSDALNTSPAAFVERVRLDAARRMLIESDAGIERVASESGFGSLRRLDRAFRRALSVSPSAFRARFQTRQQEVRP